MSDSPLLDYERLPHKPLRRGVQYKRCVADVPEWPLMQLVPWLFVISLAALAYCLLH